MKIHGFWKIIRSVFKQIFWKVFSKMSVYEFIMNNLIEWFELNT